MIGMTNRSLAGFNNTLCLSPALICTKSDLDEIVSSIDGAIKRVTEA
jgi:taurine-pyruvate aminotransferase